MADGRQSSGGRQSSQRIVVTPGTQYVGPGVSGTRPSPTVSRGGVTYTVPSGSGGSAPRGSTPTRAYRLGEMSSTQAERARAYADYFSRQAKKARNPRAKAIAQKIARKYASEVKRWNTLVEKARRGEISSPAGSVKEYEQRVKALEAKLGKEIVRKLKPSALLARVQVERQRLEEKTRQVTGKERQELTYEDYERGRKEMIKDIKEGKVGVYDEGKEQTRQALPLERKFLLEKYRVPIGPQSIAPAAMTVAGATDVLSSPARERVYFRSKDGAEEVLDVQKAPEPAPVAKTLRERVVEEVRDVLAVPGRVREDFLKNQKDPDYIKKIAVEAFKGATSDFPRQVLDLGEKTIVGVFKALQLGGRVTERVGRSIVPASVLPSERGSVVFDERGRALKPGAESVLEPVVSAAKDPQVQTAATVAGIATVATTAAAPLIRAGFNVLATERVVTFFRKPSREVFGEALLYKLDFVAKAIPLRVRSRSVPIKEVKEVREVEQARARVEPGKVGEISTARQFTYVVLKFFKKEVPLAGVVRTERVNVGGKQVRVVRDVLGRFKRVGSRVLSQEIRFGTPRDILGDLNAVKGFAQIENVTDVKFLSKMLRSKIIKKAEPFKTAEGKVGVRLGREEFEGGSKIILKAGGRRSVGAARRSVLKLGRYTLIYDTRTLKKASLKKLTAYLRKYVTFFGSWITGPQLLPRLFRKGGDVDATFKKTISDERAQEIAKRLAEILTKSEGRLIRVSKDRPTLLEDSKGNHVVDLHTAYEKYANLPFMAEEGFAGAPFGQKEVPFEGSIFRSTKGVPISEQVARKGASIFTLREVTEGPSRGRLAFMPAGHRFKDVGDFFDAAETVLTKKVFQRDKWLQLLERIRMRVPEELRTSVRPETVTPVKAPSRGSAAVSAARSSASVSRERVSRSVSRSPSVSRSFYPSPSLSASVSLSRSVSASRSPSVSRSASPSRSVSRSKSPSVSPSRSVSRSKSPSVSASPSISRSVSTGSSISQPPGLPPSPPPLKPPPRFLRLLFKSEKEVLRVVERRLRRFEYQPDLASIVFGLGIGRARAGSLLKEGRVFTGLESRPVVV